MFIKLSVLMFLTLILIYWRGNFAYHQWGGNKYQIIGHCLIPLDPCIFWDFTCTPGAWSNFTHRLVRYFNILLCFKRENVLSCKVGSFLSVRSLKPLDRLEGFHIYRTLSRFYAILQLHFRTEWPLDPMR